MPIRTQDESYQDYCFRLQAHIRLQDKELEAYREIYNTLEGLKPLLNRVEKLMGINLDTNQKDGPPPNPWEAAHGRRGEGEESEDKEGKRMNMYKIRYRMSNGEKYYQYFDQWIRASATVTDIMQGKHDWLHCYDELNNLTGIINVKQMVSMNIVKLKP